MSFKTSLTQINFLASILTKVLKRINLLRKLSKLSLQKKRSIWQTYIFFYISFIIKVFENWNKQTKNMTRYVLNNLKELRCSAVFQISFYVIVWSIPLRNKTHKLFGKSWSSGKKPWNFGLQEMKRKFSQTQMNFEFWIKFFLFSLLLTESTCLPTSIFSVCFCKPILITNCEWRI